MVLFEDLSSESPLLDLQQFVLDHDLDVKTNIGGYQKRNREDIYVDICKAYKNHKPQRKVSRRLFDVKDSHAGDDNTVTEAARYFAELSANSGMQELRDFIYKYNLPISTGGQSKLAVYMKIRDYFHDQEDVVDDPEWFYENYLSPDSPLEDLKDFIDRHSLPVKAYVGANGRTKMDICKDIENYFDEQLKSSKTSPVSFGDLSPESPIKVLRKFIADNELGINTFQKSKVSIYGDIAKVLKPIKKEKFVYDSPPPTRKLVQVKEEQTGVTTTESTKTSENGGLQGISIAIVTLVVLIAIFIALGVRM